MQSFNIIEGLEAQEYSWRKVYPRRMAATAVPTGEVEVLSFTGSVVAMKSLAEYYLGEGSAQVQVQCAVERQEAGMARLQVTRSWYGDGGDDEVEAPDDGGDDEAAGSAAESVGSSEEEPVVSFEFTEVQLPILLHPVVQEMGLNDMSPQWIALKMLSQGADLMQTFCWSLQGSEPQVSTVQEGLQGVPEKVRRLVATQEFFLDVVITARVEWVLDGRGSVPDVGEVPRIESPPKAVKLGGGRNWLLCGGGARIEGNRVIMSKVYKASGPGGWNEDSYK